MATKQIVDGVKDSDDRVAYLRDKEAGHLFLGRYRSQNVPSGLVSGTVFLANGEPAGMPGWCGFLLSNSL